MFTHLENLQKIKKTCIVLLHIYQLRFCCLLLFIFIKIVTLEICTDALVAVLFLRFVVLTFSLNMVCNEINLVILEGVLICGFYIVNVSNGIKTDDLQQLNPVDR